MIDSEAIPFIIAGWVAVAALVAPLIGRAIRYGAGTDDDTPDEPVGELVEFPRRLRLVKGGLDEAGRAADGVWRDGSGSAA